MGTNENDAVDGEMEIDLLQMLYALRRKLWLIILTGILFGAAAFGYTRLMITPLYTSTSSMLILTKETTLASLADLQLGQQLTKDYTVLIQSRPVLKEVIENLGLDIDYKELREYITIHNPTDTRVLEISVVQKDPEEAKRVVDELAKVSSAYIGDKMEVTPPKIIEDGEVPAYKSSPYTTKNVAIGAVLGMLLVCAIIVISELLNDSIQSEDDIERYLGTVTLAVVPNKERTADSGKKTRTKAGKGNK